MSVSSREKPPGKVPEHRDRFTSGAMPQCASLSWQSRGNSLSIALETQPENVVHRLAL